MFKAIPRFGYCVFDSKLDPHGMRSIDPAPVESGVAEILNVSGIS